MIYFRKKTSGKTFHMKTWILVCLNVLVLGCTSPHVQYLDEATGIATQDEVLKKLGSPKRKADFGFRGIHMALPMAL
jgi:hypothetical protein